MKTCPDCAGPMRQIVVLVPGPFGVGTGPPLQYASADARPLGRNPHVFPEGTLQHWLCSGCRHVLLYAAPAASGSELIPADPPPGRGDELTPGR
jgi:hypothetical protein